MRASSLTRLKTCSTVSKLNIYGDFDEISMSQLQNDQEGTSNIGASLIPKINGHVTGSHLAAGFISSFFSSK